jgi:hypothetical protein
MSRSHRCAARPFRVDVVGDMTIEWDVPITVNDGNVLRADVFRPTAPGSYPVVLTYGPYGKGKPFQEYQADSYPDHGRHAPGERSPAHSNLGVAFTSSGPFLHVDPGHPARRHLRRHRHRAHRPRACVLPDSAGHPRLRARAPAGHDAAIRARTPPSADRDHRPELAGRRTGTRRAGGRRSRPGQRRRSSRLRAALHLDAAAWGELKRQGPPPPENRLSLPSAFR